VPCAVVAACVATDLERLAARTLCVGFEGTQAAPGVLAALSALRPAGIILFERNVTDVEGARRLAERARQACELDDGPPLLVAYDQEGGRVARLRRGAAELPSAMALGAADDEALCERVGRALARDVRRAGGNVDFAPVLDVASDPRNTVIGTRSFGDDAQRVARLGLAVARGIERAGVAAAVKHFPGHGATAVDSHLALPTVEATIETLRARDLAPFARAATAGVSMVMTAHVAVPALEPDGRPATLSRRLLTGVLREELCFAGVCVTDCLEMGAIADTIGSERGAVEALAAGADLLVVSDHLDLAARIARAIAEAVRGGGISAARLEEAVARVDALRTRLRGQVPLPVDDAGLGREAARAALVSLREPLARWQRGSRAAVVSFEAPARGVATPVDGVAGVPRLGAALRERGVRLAEARCSSAPDEGQIRAARDAIASADDAEHVAIVVRRAQHDPAQVASARALLECAPEALVIVAREPYDAVLLPGARRVLFTFGDEGISLEAAADAMTGACVPAGRLPVAIEGA